MSYAFYHDQSLFLQLFEQKKQKGICDIFGRSGHKMIRLSFSAKNETDAPRNQLKPADGRHSQIISTVAEP